MITLAPLETIDPDAVERVLDHAFGLDRHQRTAYRLREGLTAMPGLCFAAVEDGALLATIQCWPVWHDGDDGTRTPMILVGPVAVEPARQSRGIGQCLMTASLTAARQRALDGALMLIGDPQYYGRFFGFTADPTAHWRLPGPVDRHRLLARGVQIPAAPGSIGPRLPVAA